MTITITPVGVGTVPGDQTGDTARDGMVTVNANEQNVKAAIEFLQGRFWTIRNTTLDPLVMGARYMANNHAGITFTLPAVFSTSATDFSDVWVCNADDASNVTLTPASGDAFYVSGVTLGVDTTYALTPGNMAILSPRTTDSEWDLVLVGGSGGGWADMTEAVWTGGTQSEVADGASAVAFAYNTDNSYATSGAKLFSLKNYGTEVFYVNKDGITQMGSGSNALIYVGSNGNFRANNTPTPPGGLINSIAIGTLAAGHAGSDADDSISLGANANDYVNHTGSIAIGVASSAYESYAKTIGYLGVGVHYQGFCTPGESFSANGDNQCLLWQPAATTTDATPAVLYLDEDAATKRMTLAAGKLYAFEAHVVGIQSDGTDASYFTRKGIIANNSGTTALIGAVQTVGTDIESNASTDVAITADDSNDALQISVTGIAAETWRWSANVFVKDITIGT